MNIYISSKIKVTFLLFFLIISLSYLFYNNKVFSLESANLNNTSSVPYNLSYQITNNAVKIYWNYNSNNNYNFKIYKNNNTTPIYSVNSTFGTTSYFYIDDLTNNKGVTNTYYVKACLLENIFNCVNSNIITVVPIEEYVFTGSQTNTISTISPTTSTSTQTTATIPNTITTTTTIPIATSNTTTSTSTQTTTTPTVTTQTNTTTALIADSFDKTNTFETTNIKNYNGSLLSPSNFTALFDKTSQKIYLKWSDNSSNEKNFLIFKKTFGATTKDFYLLATLNSNITEYQDSDIVPESYYKYYIKSCNLDGCSPDVYSNEVLINYSIKTIKEIIANNNTTNTQTTSTIKNETNISNTTNKITTQSQGGYNTIGEFDVKNTLKPTTTTKLVQENNKEEIVPVFDIKKEKDTLISKINSSSQDELLKNLETNIQKTKELNKNTILAKEELIKNINLAFDSLSFDLSDENKEKILIYRNEVLNKINNYFSSLDLSNNQDIDLFSKNLDKEINVFLSKIIEQTLDSKQDKNKLIDIEKEFTQVNQLLKIKSSSIKQEGLSIFYQDTNKDGVSDYDSLYVYNIDPVLPSPVSVLPDGKKINASEKILLGYDPKKTDLININLEEPKESDINIIKDYSINEVKLTTEKLVTIKGNALPNSFVSLYIYSNPIMVTIKTNSLGEWEYVLDKELEDGNHSIYVATVNNTGKILARSEGYFFAKTAEAITFQDVPLAQVYEPVKEPSILGNVNLYLLSGIILVIILSIFVLLGMYNQKNKEGIK